MVGLDEKKLRDGLAWAAKYGGVPQSSQENFQRDYFETMAVAVGTYPLVDFAVATGRVLDLTTIRFRLGVRAPGHLLSDAADDLASLGFLRFLLRVQGRNPMDQGATIAALNQPKPPAGYIVLNRNILGESDDMPAHLIVREGQRVSIDYTVIVAAPFLTGPYIGVELKGRWIAQKHFNDIIKVKF
jgi:hypothetical protein